MNADLTQDLIALCMKYGFIGFAGGFRTPGDNWEVHHLEAPGFRDLKCRAVRLHINNFIERQGGYDTTTEEGDIKPKLPPKPTNLS